MSEEAKNELKSILWQSTSRRKAYEAIMLEITKALRRSVQGRISPRWFQNARTEEGAYLLPLFDRGRNDTPAYLVIVSYPTGRLHAKTIYDRSIVDFDCGQLFVA